MDFSIDRNNRNLHRQGAPEYNAGRSNRACCVASVPQRTCDPRREFPEHSSRMAEILVLFYSRKGSTAELARQVCRGVESVSRRTRAIAHGSASDRRRRAAAAARSCRRSSLCDARRPARMRWLGARQPDALRQHGRAAQALPRRHQRVVGQRRRSSGKPAAVFTSTQTMHGGQETTLVSMMLPLLHHGMYIVGLPYTEAALNQTDDAAARPTARATSPAAEAPARNLSDDERVLAAAARHAQSPSSRSGSNSSGSRSDEVTDCEGRGIGASIGLPHVWCSSRSLLWSCWSPGITTCVWLAAVIALRRLLWDCVALLRRGSARVCMDDACGRALPRVRAHRAHREPGLASLGSGRACCGVHAVCRADRLSCA